MRRPPILSMFVIALLLMTLAATWLALHDASGRVAIESPVMALPSAPVTASPEYRAVLHARDADAWAARQELELRLAVIASTVTALGGELRRGESRYRRVPVAPRLDHRPAPMTIEQEIFVAIPDTAAWRQLRDDIVHLEARSR